jgi:hypothetical protein
MVNKKTVCSIAYLATLMSLLVPSLSVWAQSTSGTGKIKINPEQIPVVPSALPVLRLSTQKAPKEFVKQLLPNVAPAARNLEPLAQNRLFRDRGIQAPSELVGAVEGDHLAAYVDQNSGDAEVFPLLSQQKPLSANASVDATAIASKVFSRPDIIAKDDTRTSLDKPLTLNQSTATRGASANAAKTNALLTYVPLRRYVSHYAVSGPGSRALVVVGNGGSLQGFLRRWKTAKNLSQVTETRSRAQVAQLIQAQLESFAKKSDVEVKSVEIGYYDGNQNYLQPVYRFKARIGPSTPATSSAQSLGTKGEFVIGYVPIGKELEPIPSLSAPAEQLPTTPSTKPANSVLQRLSSAASSSLSTNSAVKPLGVASILVGRYVVREDNQGWVDNANKFWNSLSSSPNASSFGNSQYYWAEPRTYYGESKSYIDSVDIALTEAHGDWWLFTNYKNYGDVVEVGKIAYPGYGKAAGGRLSYWVIHSCEVVPTLEDTSKWADPWWNVFGGLHSVLGYRTIMYINDGVGAAFGRDIGKAAPVVSAWFNAVSTNSFYAGNPKEPAHDGIIRPAGRASAISVCDHENDTVFNTSSIGRPGCLRANWFRD